MLCICFLTSSKPSSASSSFSALLVTRWLLKLFRPLVKNEEKFLSLSREGGNN